MNIILATGGSGGHIFPALKVAEQLTRKGNKVFFVGAFQSGLSHIQRSGYSYATISARGMSVWPPQKAVGSFYFMTKAVLESLRILKYFKPDCVCGFGGYGSFPLVLSAVFLKYPTMIHEQNVVPGKANLFLSKYVKRIALTFEESSRYFKSGRTVVTGCPVHAVFPDEGNPEREKIFRRFQLDPRKKTILILGGSQGSHRINLEVMNTLEFLKQLSNIQVIHVGGKKDHQNLKTTYEKSGVPFRLFEFLDEMGAAYQMADLIISRAGALTVLEIAQFQIPSILIPYPFAGGHQKENAKILETMGTAKIIEEKNLNTELLQQTIKEFLAKTWDKEMMKKKSEGIVAINASSRITEEIGRLVSRKERKR